MARSFISLLDAADILGVDHRTIRRRISEGRLKGYKIQGTRMMRVDRDEVIALAQPIPTVNRTAS